MAVDGVVLVTDVIDGQGWRGSGVIIGPHTILTASHVLWEQDVGQGASQVNLYPDYLPGNSPIAGQEVWHFNQVNDSGGMMSQASSASDFAIIDVSTDLSAYTQFGLYANYTGGTVHLTGYPASAGVTQTDVVGTVFADPNYNVLDYGSVSASPGNSGGPLWINTASGPEVVGIVSTTGWAAKLTTADIQQIMAWENQDSFLWNPITPTTTYTYDSHGNVATETTHAADGNTYYSDFNLQHLANWAYAVSTYDSQGALTFTTIHETDGTALVTTYDPHSLHGWHDAVSAYNTAGQITYASVRMTSGYEYLTVYDHPGSNAGYMVYEYNPAHQLIDSHHEGIITA
jgi:YD repeat-containing protein